MASPTSRGAGIPRIRSVISSSRLSHIQPPPEDARLARLWDRCRESVGAVRVNGECCVTAWRLPGHPPRLATAGHALWWLLPAGERTGTGGEEVAGAEVVFADDASDGTAGIPIRRCILAHPKWDLCLLELDSDGTGLPPPLDIAPVQEAGDDPFAWDRRRDVAVIGYPGDTDGTGRIFHGKWLRHVSAGLVLGPSPLGIALRGDERPPDGWGDCTAPHDVSTCPGFSGAPVFDLETCKVVGIHILGSALGIDDSRMSDWNDMVDLSAARSDAWLDDRLQGLNTAAVAAPAKPVNWVGAGMNARRNNEEALRRMARRLRQLRPGHLLTGVSADRPDFRDFPFVPSLAAPLPQVLPDKVAGIGDQKGDPTCAAFAVAAAIEPQLPPLASGAACRVSVRMLNALARDYDEFIDDDRPGTTLRGVLKAFFDNGVCLRETGGDGTDRQPFLLTRTMAKEARAITLGAYFKVSPVLSDMQMAVQQAGGVVVSAHIHKGWQPPDPLRPGRAARIETIPFAGLADHPREGAHAFLVTGYTDTGFVVRNSWGERWGWWDKRPGHALWTYADWAANVIDAWVIRLAAPAPAGFGLIAGSSADSQLPAARRAQLLGHMIQTESDRIVERGTLGLGLPAIRESARFLAGSDPGDRESSGDYRHLAFVFHDAMLGGDLIGRIAARMTPLMKARRTYPIHVCHGLDELRTLALRLTADADLIRAGFARSLESSDHYLERHVAPVAQRLIEQYRQGATRSAPLREALGGFLARGVLRPGWLPKARRVTVLGVGIGAVPAMAAADLFGRAARLFLAPPVGVPPGSTIWQLGPRRDEGPVPGYPGEWLDLLSVSLAQDAAPRGTDPKGFGFGWDSLSAALTDPALVARLCDRRRG